MKIFNDPKRKYLLLLPFVFLIFNAFYFQYATKEIKKTLLQEKIVEITAEVNMLATAIEAKPEMVWKGHEETIIDSVEFLDKLFQVYAGAYKYVDGELVSITERYYETSIFEPFDYPELEQTILSQESGHYAIGYTPKGQKYRELYMYFRWVPDYSPKDDRYLIIAGVSEHSITTAIPLLVSIGQWVSTTVTFILNVILIILVVRLGYIYESRKGKKWRDGGEYHV